ncbi:MAG: DNA double-strand break repair nuclease NurA [Chloroflexi bacterium]|nr:DNA double-strand break repair nuclease NurA [Chloroflexota bacterium]
MPLNLDSVSQQIDALAADLQAQGQDRAQRLLLALQTLASADGHALNRKHDAGRFAWPAPRLPASPSAHFAAPAAPSDYRALATDGSHIDVERHLAARCALVNISKVMLQYGQNPGARLESTPTLYTGDSLSLKVPQTAQEYPLEGPLMGIQRSIDEVVALAELAEDTAGDASRLYRDRLPTLALIDGSLILWGPADQQYPDEIRRTLLEERLIPALARLQALNDKGPLALAAYVSLPSSAGVANALRLAHCPYPAPQCDQYCGHLRAGDRPCDNVGGLLDRDLMAQTLAPGERSALFESASSIVERFYQGHEVSFFYLNAGDEIARVEVPAWVANNDALLDLAHAAVLDQCRRGLGYPAAIMEAHEQAVINGHERELFCQMVEEALAGSRLPVYTSGKAWSKRTRWV